MVLAIIVHTEILLPRIIIRITRMATEGAIVDIIILVVEPFRLEVEFIIRKGIIEATAEVETTGAVVMEITIIEVEVGDGTIAESIMTLSITSIWATIGADSPAISTEEEVEELT